MSQFSPRALPERYDVPYHATVDSASALHIASPGAAAEAAFSATSPSGVRCEMADGSIVNASGSGTISLSSPETYGLSPDDLVVFHVLPGNRNWLLSLPELSKAGFDFFLTDRGPSLMFPPSGDPVVLRRTSGSSGN